MRMLIKKLASASNLSYIRLSAVRYSSSDAKAKSQDSKAEIKEEEFKKNIVVEKYGGIMTLNIDRQKTRNSLDEQTLREMETAIEAFDKDKDAKVLVFNGEGGSFCSGFDMDEMGEKGYNTLKDAASTRSGLSAAYGIRPGALHYYICGPEGLMLFLSTPITGHIPLALIVAWHPPDAEAMLPQGPPPSPYSPATVAPTRVDCPDGREELAPSQFLRTMSMTLLKSTRSGLSAAYGIRPGALHYYICGPEGLMLFLSTPITGHIPLALIVAWHPPDAEAMLPQGPPPSPYSPATVAPTRVDCPDGREELAPSQFLRTMSMKLLKRRLLRRPLCDKPTIAAVTGYAVAEGFELALACDLRVIEDTAVLGFLGRRFGVPISLYGGRRLTSLIGLSQALDLLMTGRLISGTEANQKGLAAKVTATGTGLGESIKLAKSIAKFPQHAIIMDKLAAVNSQLNPNSEESMRDEAVMQSLLGLALEDLKEGVKKFQDGVGKHGKFYNLTEVPLEDWEIETSVEETVVTHDDEKKK